MTIEDFTDIDEVRSAIIEAEQLKNKKFSNVTDDHGFQYVNLVQEGGGVLGIALVGFTYVLECAGIRFWRLAGTSAGAINAMLLAAVGQKSEAKSERILNDLAGAELLNFADGHEDIPKILQRLSIDPGYLKKVGILILAPLFMFTINLLFLSLHHNPWLSKFTWILFLMLLGIAAYLWYLWQRLKKAKWGICKGLEFHKWIKGILDKNGISSMVELRERCYLTHEELNLRMPNSSHFAGSDLTLITCDITRGLKVQFPKDMPDYNLNDADTHPSDFVRASMSIPIFYESFFFEKAALSADLFNTIKDQNQESLAAFFIDGGVVSNFPINVFHNPKIRTPRIPVIGIRLNDGIEPTEKDIFKSMISYVYRIFNTIRYHSDKEFLRQYQFYQEHCVHEVNLKGFNWLNFAMNDEEKKLLFAKGVSAGLKFIQEFNWEQYTAAREKLFDSTT